MQVFNRSPALGQTARARAYWLLHVSSARLSWLDFLVAKSPNPKSTKHRKCITFALNHFSKVYPIIPQLLFINIPFPPCLTGCNSRKWVTALEAAWSHRVNAAQLPEVMTTTTHNCDAARSAAAAARLRSGSSLRPAKNNKPILFWLKLRQADWEHQIEWIS